MSTLEETTDSTERHRPFLKQLDIITSGTGITRTPVDTPKRPCLLKIPNRKGIGTELALAINRHGYFIIGVTIRADEMWVHITEQ